VEIVKLTVTSGAGAPREIEVTGERFVIGRDESADLTLGDDEEVSRQHAAVLRLADGRLEIEDLGSTNGTFVDERRIAAPTALSGGEEIRIGTTVLVAEAATAETRVAPPPAPAPVPPPAQMAPAPVQSPPQPQPAPPVSQPEPESQAPRYGRRGSTQLTIAAILVAGTSIALVLFMTLNWFEATEANAPEGSVELTEEVRSLIEEDEGRQIDFSANAWQAFSGFDFLFVIVAALGLAFGVALLLTRSATVAAVGALAFGGASLVVAILIATKLVSTPDLVGFIANQTPEGTADAGVSVDSSVEIGAILGLAAAIGGIAASAFAAFAARPRP
jgi:hypothetical protein